MTEQQMAELVSENEPSPIWMMLTVDTNDGSIVEADHEARERVVEVLFDDYGGEAACAGR